MTFFRQRLNEKSKRGKYCGKDTYTCDATVSISINDLDMFSLFSKADAYLGAFEQEYAFRYNLLGNFNKLYCLLKNEMGNQIREAFKSLEKAEETEDEQMAS